jgi:hypothetical protein
VRVYLACSSSLIGGGQQFGVPAAQHSGPFCSGLDGTSNPRPSARLPRAADATTFIPFAGGPSPMTILLHALSIESSVKRGTRHWWRGWLRLAMATYLFAWLGTWIWLSRDSAQDAQLLLFCSVICRQHGLTSRLAKNSWSVVAATDEFAALSPDAQRARASQFYDSEIADLATTLYYDADG